MKKLKLFAMMLCIAAMGLATACTKENNSQQNSDDSEVTIIGSWKYSFSSGYVMLTFDNDGYMRYYEFDHGDTQTDKYYQYTYSGNLLILTRENHTKQIAVETLSKDKLVLKDWPDGGLCVFIKQ